jgi:hypothetical protein
VTALKIIGCTVVGGYLGFVGGMVYAMGNMEPERMFAPFIGIVVGGAAGVVVGSVVFT